MKAERQYTDAFFWALVGIPEDPQDRHVLYYIIPAMEMATNVAECFQMWCDAKGKGGLAHDPENTIRSVRLPPHPNRNHWDISKHLDAWHLIERHLAGVQH
jgi:hypothetical protein